jgi:hypothetical protein
MLPNTLPAAFCRHMVQPGVSSYQLLECQEMSSRVPRKDLDDLLPDSTINDVSVVEPRDYE